SSSRQIIYSK
ncbi:hypothetical protein E2320_015889, partial [Naja naja]